MKLISILLGFLCLQTTLAQELNVADWQKTHPEILFVELETYNSFSEEQLNKLGQNIIVFNHEIQESDIKRFLTQKNLKTNGNVLYECADPYADYFKQWIGEHQGIKIIRRSYFDNTTETERTLLINMDALILIGEELTITDIENYDAN